VVQKSGAAQKFASRIHLELSWTAEDWGSTSWLLEQSLVQQLEQYYAEQYYAHQSPITIQKICNTAFFTRKTYCQQLELWLPFVIVHPRRILPQFHSICETTLHTPRIMLSDINAAIVLCKMSISTQIYRPTNILWIG
jgi:hypothetical protein